MKLEDEITCCLVSDFPNQKRLSGIFTRWLRLGRHCVLKVGNNGLVYLPHSPGGLGSKHLTRLDWMMGYFKHIKIIIIKDVWINACVWIEIPEKVSTLVLYVSLGKHSVTICSPKQKLSTNVVPILFDPR